MYNWSREPTTTCIRCARLQPRVQRVKVIRPLTPVPREDLETKAELYDVDSDSDEEPPAVERVVSIEEVELGENNPMDEVFVPRPLTLQERMASDPELAAQLLALGVSV